MKWLMSLWKSLARLRQAWLISLSARSIERLATLTWCVKSLFNARERWNGITRYEMGRELWLLDAADKWRAMTGKTLETLLDRRFHDGRVARPDEAWPDLREVARTLARQIVALRGDDPARPVILSPFHYVSQCAYVYVLDEVRKALGLETLSAVTGVFAGKEMVMPRLEPLYTRDDGQRNNLGLRVIQALRRDGVVVLFADAAPYTMHRFPMETVDVTVLGRPGRIHGGVFRIGARMNTVLLPFYLRFTHGRFSAEILEAVELASPDAPQQVADRISIALKGNYAHWLMAGHPSMYGFASVK